MAIWQWGLLLLVIVWALQSLGVWLQMRHYSDVFKGVTDQYKDGFVGAGNFRGRFAKGTIALVVVTPDMVVRRLMVMSGRSVFTKFKRHEEFEDRTDRQNTVGAGEEAGPIRLERSKGLEPDDFRPNRPEI
jgi:glucitol operon activator protein